MHFIRIHANIVPKQCLMYPHTLFAITPYISPIPFYHRCCSIITLAFNTSGLALHTSQSQDHSNSLQVTRSKTLTKQQRRLPQCLPPRFPLQRSPLHLQHPPLSPRRLPNQQRRSTNAYTPVPPLEPTIPKRESPSFARNSTRQSLES